MCTTKLLAPSTLMTGLLSIKNVFAETHKVIAQGMIFNQLVVHIAPSDTVAWDKLSAHNVEMITDLIPKSTQIFILPMGENYRHTFEDEGIHIHI